MKKKSVLRIIVLVMVAAVAFAVVHFAVLGNNSPTDTAFTFAVEDGKAILTGSTDPLSGAVMLPETISGYTVVGIGENAFKDCVDVTAFFMPDTITSIGAYAFENCTSMAQAILPSGLTSIGEGAFWKCSSLVSVTVPASVKSIGSCAFYKCDAMESLIVPGTATPIQGIFNVALDIGQTVAIGNPARQALDPITTTVYCYAGSVANSNALEDAYSDLAFLDNCTLTSYTVRYTDVNDADVAPAFTLGMQPAGIRVAAVATVVADEELVYPDPGVQTIELTENAAENTITFVYTVRTYTVTFDTDGGEAVAPLTFATTDDAVLGSTTRRGYTFTGWKVAQVPDDTHYNWGDVDTLYEATDVVTGKFGDVTLKAVWQPIGVNVIFDAQGGTADAESMTATFGEVYGELADAAREGYTFDGWYTQDGTKIESTTTVTAVEEHTLYARWTINKYSVTVTTDGNGTASADLTEDVEYGTVVTLSAEPATGFEFDKWVSEDVTVENDAFTMPDKAVAVQAAFKAIEYTISFDTDGGDAREAMTYTITDDTAIGTATKPGYTLAYWNVTQTDGNWGIINKAYMPDNVVTGKYGNIALKAIWKGNSLTVTFDAQGGTVPIESKTVTVGGTYGTLAIATREGYTFEGWYSAEDGGSKIESTTTVTQVEDHSLYARWTINQYNVTLANDGNGSVSASATNNVAYGTLVTLTATPKAGFRFDAWVSSDVTVEDNAFTMPDKAVLVRATFAPLEYTVTFDTDGGDAKEALIYKTTDETTLGSATRAGYTFLRWIVSKQAESGDYNWGGTQKTYESSQSVRNKFGDVTLKALWEGNTIVVFYDGLGGAPSEENKSVTVGGTYGELASATMEGYTFVGWFTEEQGGSQITADTVVTATERQTLYAHWTINKYNVTVTTDGHGTASADKTTDVEYDSLVTLTAEADTGYSFLAWASNDVAVIGNSFTMPDRAVNVQAIFSANTYKIAFDANGGQNEMDEIDATYDADVELPACGFERTGFAFLGWAESADAETPVYEDGATVRNLTSENGETVTLYALWKDIKVELIAKEGSTTVIDEDTHFIYGLKLEIKKSELLNDYLDVVGNGRLELSEGTLGTGTTVELYNENTGELVGTYTIIIFGDLNHDGIVNSSDVTEARQISAKMKDSDLSNPYAFAANLVPDETVNLSDVTVIRMMAAKMATINQVTREKTVVSE